MNKEISQTCPKQPVFSLVVLEAWPWPRSISSRTPHEGLGLGLHLMSLPWPRPTLFFENPGHVVACSSAHTTHGVT